MTDIENLEEIKSKAEAMTDENSFQVVSFQLGEEEFGINIFNVKEIINTIQMTRVPNAPPYVVGVVNMRGRVIPIVDLYIRFGLSEKTQNKNNNGKVIIFIEYGNLSVGLLVDGVREVIRISNSITEPPPAMVSGIHADYITSIAKLESRLLILLDIAKILEVKSEVEV